MDRRDIWMASLLALGCASRAVELDHDTGPVVTSSSAPGGVGVAHEFVNRLAVEGARLYWQGNRAVPEGLLGDSTCTLRSCEKENCAASVITYSARSLSAFAGICPTLLGVSGGELYWAEGPAARACPITGCEGEPRTVFNAAPDLGVGAAWQGGFAMEDAELYYVNATYDQVNRLYQLALDGAAQPRLIASLGVGAPKSIQSHGDYVYWTNFNLLASSTIERIRKDGTAPEETFASELVDPGVLAFDSDHVYWAKSVLVGALNRCAVTGCAGAAEVLAAPLRVPQDIVLDGSKVFWSYSIDGGEPGLASCDAADCMPQEPRARGFDAFAIDDHYIYLAKSPAHGDSSQYYPLPEFAEFTRVAK